MTYQLTGQQYRALHAVKCNDKDVRYYLRGIYLDGDKAYATNGHMLYECSAQNEDMEPVIIESHKIPANIEHVMISKMDSDTYKIATTTRTGEQGPQYLSKVIDGRYPDCKAVITSAENGHSEPFCMFGFDADYLAMIKTVFGKGAKVNFDMLTMHTAAVITSTREEEGKLLLMPLNMNHRVQRKAA